MPNLNTRGVRGATECHALAASPDRRALKVESGVRSWGDCGAGTLRERFRFVRNRLVPRGVGR
jgi:hypothetical protein